VVHWDLDLQRGRSPILRYGFSVVCVAIALSVALAFQRFGFRDVEMPLFGLAIVVATWYAGVGPSVLAVALSAACFDYFFTEPFFAFTISGPDLANFFLFVICGIIAASFVAVRRRIEEDLRSARDHLAAEVELRKQREDEIRRLNQELAKRAFDLEAGNKELESFAYSVSHDLRAPLRHAVGFAELLHKHASSVLDDKGRRYVLTILEASKRMGNLIDDLLSFSRIGRAEAKMARVGLDQLVREVMAEIGPETKERDIAWKIDALPACYGDRSMLKLVMANLVSNAVKFTRMRKPAEIEIGCAGETGDRIEIFVRDNGAGFDMAYVNKLFGVFQRLHLPEEFEGTGIGLATVQRIILRHGGHVRAEGAVDRGATFSFTLPTTADAKEKTGDRT
jgi:signal transduction histidine kinase